MISDSSADTSSTAPPRSRQAVISPWMNSMAPMSTPRVGCSAISSGASWLISRATTTFCRLPPDRVPTRVAGLATLMANRSINSRARAVMAERCSKP